MCTALLATTLPASFAPAAPAANPEFCSPLSAPPLDFSTITSERVRRMAELFQRKANEGHPFDNPFRNVETAAALRQIAPERGHGETAQQFHLTFADALLRSGEPEQALAHFIQAERFAREQSPEFPASAEVMFETSKALCHLRIGEQENCITGHNAESCLLPIRGGGIHEFKRGSRAAVNTLLPLLQRYPNDLRARWLLNVAYMTLGQYPAEVPPQWLIDPKVFESDYDIKRFPDVAGPLGLAVNDLAGGVVMDDFDNDGLLDLMVSSWHPRSQLRLFRNRGDGSFEDRTAASGLVGETGGLNLIQADYNNDGFVDVLLLRGAWLDQHGKHPNSLLRNNGDGTFDDVTVEAGLLSFHPTQTAAWLDYDGDGDLDLFIANESSKDAYHPCELYRNNGNGTFTECAAENGVALLGYIKGVVAGDFNNDGRPDLYLSRRGGGNFLLRNDGPVASADHTDAPTWRFTDVAKAAGVTEPFRSFSCWFWDYDHDGWLDLMVAGYGYQDSGDIAADYLGLPHGAERVRLFRNRRDGTFADATREAGLYKTLHTMGCNFGDLDNDGWLDFYVGTGDPEFSTLIPNRMFRNDGHGRFQDVTTAGGFGQLQKGHGIAFGDLDNDGDQDIYSVVGGAFEADSYHNQLFANPGHGHRWLKLQLQGVRSVRDAHGARIKVVVETPAGERTLYCTVGSGGSFGASPLRQEIGLADATKILRVEVLWPATGATQTLTGLALDSFYQIREDATQAVAVAIRSFQLPDGTGASREHPLHAHTPRSGSVPAEVAALR